MRYAAIALAAACLAACNSGSTSTPSTVQAATPKLLQEQSREFEKGLSLVVPNVWVATGYGIANSILLKGSEGCVVVDTMESIESAQAVEALFRPHCPNGYAAIIYTHSHPDHVGGASVFAGPNTPVYAQAGVPAAMDKINSEIQPIITRRSMTMYGHGLSPSELLNVGIGPNVDLHEGSTIGTRRPTQLFETKASIQAGGMTLELVHAPGETDDQIFVWLPDRKILLPGDNLYRAFPNLYTIRGTNYRDPKRWAQSLDAMRRLRPEVLVPSHTRPIVGGDTIQQVLTDYRDAIRTVYDQSIYAMNRGASPDELQASVRLPAHLARSPWLQELYGTPGWSARSIYTGNLGWFDADPAHLRPLPPQERARAYVALAGGESGMNQQIAAADKAGNYAWVLELTSHALATNPANGAAKASRLKALKALGEADSNPNARHFYLVAWHELNGDYRVPTRVLNPTPEMLSTMPMTTFFDGMQVNLNPESAAGKDTVVRFSFTDSGEDWTYVLRKGVSEVIPPADVASAPVPTIVVKVSAQAFKETLAKVRNPALALAQDFSVTTGSKLELAKFLRMFNAVE